MLGREKDTFSLFFFQTEGGRLFDMSYLTFFFFFFELFQLKQTGVGFVYVVERMEVVEGFCILCLIPQLSNFFTGFPWDGRICKVTHFGRQINNGMQKSAILQKFMNYPIICGCLCVQILDIVKQFLCSGHACTCEMTSKSESMDLNFSNFS